MKTKLKDQLIEKAKGLKLLPTLSTIMGEPFKIMNDESSSIAMLAGVVKYDQAVSSQLISIANSAFYRRDTAITSLDRAMSVIGLHEVKNTLMCLSLVRGMSPVVGQNKLSTLWTDNLAVACSAKTFA